MANINDYLEWRGDLSMSTSKFNEIDSMILARFSYLLFNKINVKEKETIKTISDKMKDFPNEEFRYNGDKEMITLLGKSSRFKNMIVTDFVENTDKTVEKQFSAITIHNAKKEIYISFIGTDSSIIGWKEDFNMAFMESVPAQIAGLEYVETISKKYPDVKIRIGGHSKGGSIAIFSAISATKEIQDRIIQVCNYDGPGLVKEIMEKNENIQILEKIHTYFPQDSVIGRILEHKEECTVVKSMQKGIYQHDIFSWQVVGTQMITLPNLTNSSEFMYKAIREWLQKTEPEQRKIFFDGIFEIFYSSDATTFGEISNSITKHLPTFIKTYKGLSEEDRKTITSMLIEFGKLSANVFKKDEIPKINVSRFFNKGTLQTKE